MPIPILPDRLIPKPVTESRMALTGSSHLKSRTIPAALVADGVPKDKLYPLDLDRAFKKLDEIKPHIKVWWLART